MMKQFFGSRMSRLLVASLLPLAVVGCKGSGAEVKTFELKTSAMESAKSVNVSVEIPSTFEEDYDDLDLELLPRGSEDFDFDGLTILAVSCQPTDDGDGCDIDRLLEGVRFGDKLASATREEIAGGREWVTSETDAAILSELLVPAGDNIVVVCTMNLSEHRDRLEDYRQVCESVKVVE